MNPTYILTAELDPDSFAWLDGLRQQHFPPERNLLPAKIPGLLVWEYLGGPWSPVRRLPLA